jgi:putative inorganic carbon (HCO3(-)) transporter
LRWAGWLVLLAGLALTIAVVPGVHFYPGQKLPFIDRSIYEFLPSGLKLPGDENGFNPNMAGGLLAIFLPPALALSLRAQNWGQRILAAFTFLTLFVAVLLTQSRGATLGVLVAIAVVTGLMYRSLRWLWWAAGVLMLGFLAVRGDVVVGFLSDAEATGGVHSLAQRAELWSRAIYAGQDFAFTGIGLGSFPAVIALLYPAFQVIITADVPHAHNVYLQALAEMGYPGLILYLAFFITLFFVLLRRVRLAVGWRRSLAVGLLGSLVVFLVHGLVDVPTYSPISAIVFWGMFGLMMAVGMNNEEFKSQNAKSGQSPRPEH